jgi:hypothetical protein
MTTYSAMPGLPASPTLTNPDMILPYGEYDPTPSPPHDTIDMTAIDAAWRNAGPDDVNFSLGPSAYGSQGVTPMTPITPIIYGNGTMLSDIGEVTEAESTPGRKPRLYTRAGGRESPVRPSTSKTWDTTTKHTKVGNHHRSVSVETNSTVTTEGQAAEMFKDFDDGVSVDDRNFQGDDEESILDDGYDNEVEIAQAKVITRKESRLITTDDISSAALSKRAEMILANAKKRLDVSCCGPMRGSCLLNFQNMEGNLTRARSSLFITPSSSMSSIHASSPLSRSTPSPPEANRRIVPALGLPPAKNRETNYPFTPSTGSSGHSRILSETSVPSALMSPLRAAHSQLDGYESPTQQETSRAPIPTTYVTPSSRQSNHLGSPLQTLSEDDSSPVSDQGRVFVRSSTAEPHSNIQYDHQGLTRSTSSMQMRDLTDKMKDLKGKISTLRDRAREDTLKRRSLQSLRTPSPFTSAEQWYTNSKGHGSSQTNGASRLSLSPWNGEPSVTESADEVGQETEERESHPHEQVNGLNGHSDGHDEGEKEKVVQDDEEDFIEAVPHTAHINHEMSGASTEPESSYDTADEGEENTVLDSRQNDEAEEEPYEEEVIDQYDEDYESESDASLYHDTRQTPISHEDREDAFDYEHFFLHSAMGTINAQRLARRGSFSSEDSVETTRGPGVPATSGDGSDSRPGHIRSQQSTDSISTLASFATATEGRRSSDIRNGHDYFKSVAEKVPALVAKRPTTSIGEKRTTFGPWATPPASPAKPRSHSPISRPTSIIRAASAAAAMGQGTRHHASVSSFASTGTTRSFPLVNKPKDQERRLSVLSEALNLNSTGKPFSAMDVLAKDDKILVERLLASVGKCILGMEEAGRASTEGRMWRRRLDAARRILDGQEGGL